ncbi:hypothetical protein E3N88_44345 [Mikania micrantha]|uniref:Uncharacterized protein n=1 Tax=Mikania micrantha TaxID=192012 RepID=A0A5N6LCJ4_9ASTR|nr:hypothetical protein E3N88_44345 [Mikania micrantha]
MISIDLLHTILIPKSTAARAWNALANIFHDNKSSLRSISERDAPVSDQQLVLQLINGLTGNKLDAVGMMLQQTSPLPDFYVARSRFILEETRQAQHPQPDTALHAATTQPTPAAPIPPAYSQPPTYSPHSHSPDSTRGRGRGRGSRSLGRGRRNPSNTRGPPGFQGQQHQFSPWPPQHQPWRTSQQPWITPPVPYPTVPTHSQRGPPPRGSTTGILGQEPS